MERAHYSNVIIIIGWLMFLVCLILPAIIDKADEINGYKVGLLAIKEIPDITAYINKNEWPYISVSGIGNIVAAFSILIVFIKHKKLLMATAIIFAFIGINNASYYIRGNSGEGLGSGYFLWVAAYFVLALGCLAMANKNPNNVFMSFASLIGTEPTPI